jgi:hypothetical protein
MAGKRKPKGSQIEILAEIRDLNDRACGIVRSALMVVLAGMASGGCRGLLNPIESDASAPTDGGGPSDASTDAEPSDSTTSVPPCSVDAAWESGPCVPPADDLLEVSPAVVNVAAGSYGAARIIASGPWASDPSLILAFESSTLPLGSQPIITPYGWLAFLVPSSVSPGQEGTITVAGFAGNIGRTAQATVHVTDCLPWLQAVACESRMCGFQPDGCGGLLTCGSCGSAAPYCWIGQCVTHPFTPCPPGDGFAPDSGDCVPCGACPDFDSDCECQVLPIPLAPVVTDGGAPPADGGSGLPCSPFQPYESDSSHTACPINQSCNFDNARMNQTICAGPVGPRTQGQECFGQSDCAAGFDCRVVQGTLQYCERYCRYGAAFDDCGTHYICEPFFIAAYDGNQEIGLCE